MIIWSSINFPTVICLPTVFYFSREKPLVKPTAPRVSFSYYLPLRSTFPLLLFSDLLNQKYKNNLLQFFFILFSVRSINLLQIYLTSVCLSWGAVPRKGLTTPLTRRVARSLFVCRCCLRCVAWFSYWFDNLGFIFEGNTYRRCVASSLPLWGNTDVASSHIKRNFWRRCRGGSSTYTRFLITNLISSQFTLFFICLSFSSPPLHKIYRFIRLSFLFPILLLSSLDG